MPCWVFPPDSQPPAKKARISLEGFLESGSESEHGETPGRERSREGGRRGQRRMRRVMDFSSEDEEESKVPETSVAAHGGRNNEGEGTGVPPVQGQRRRFVDSSGEESDTGGEVEGETDSSGEESEAGGEARGEVDSSGGESEAGGEAEGEEMEVGGEAGGEAPEVGREVCSRPGVLSVSRACPAPEDQSSDEEDGLAISLED